MALKPTPWLAVRLARALVLRSRGTSRPRRTTCCAGTPIFRDAAARHQIPEVFSSVRLSRFSCHDCFSPPRFRSAWRPLHAACHPCDPHGQPLPVNRQHGHGALLQLTHSVIACPEKEQCSFEISCFRQASPPPFIVRPDRQKARLQYGSSLRGRGVKDTSKIPSSHGSCSCFRRA